MTCRDWLQANGYKDVALLVDNAIAKMAARGSRERRNWWDILSGSVEGAVRARRYRVPGVAHRSNPPKQTNHQECDLKEQPRNTAGDRDDWPLAGKREATNRRSRSKEPPV